MTTDELKKAVALAALDYVQAGALVGVGTGSTVNHFIDGLGAGGTRPLAAVSSSQASTARLQAVGIEVISLDDVFARGLAIPVYVDGADEIDPSMAMIKGGGGALTREKIVAAAADQFVCIVDQSKQVQTLGAFPLPIEVVGMAVGLVASRLKALGAEPKLRDGFITDNGHPIIDAHGLAINDPKALETAINQWPGVVTVGLFAHRAADVCLVGSAEHGVQSVTKR